MKAPSYGWVVLGASTVLYGIIALMWHDPDTWQTPYRILSLPFGVAIGDALMIAAIAGGLALAIPRTSRAGSIVLGIVFAVFSLACIPGIVAAPNAYVYYGSFFEQFSVLIGAVAVYAATEPNPPRAATIGRISRIGLGACAISFALAQIFYLRFTASLVPAWLLFGQTFWAIVTTIAFALAAIALLANLQARLAARLLTLMIVLFGLFVWVPRLIARPGSHGNWSEFALNFLIAGAAWTVAELQSARRKRSTLVSVT